MGLLARDCCAGPRGREDSSSVAGRLPAARDRTRATDRIGQERGRFAIATRGDAPQGRGAVGSTGRCMDGRAVFEALCNAPPHRSRSNSSLRSRWRPEGPWRTRWRRRRPASPRSGCPFTAEAESRGVALLRCAAGDPLGSGLRLVRRGTERTARRSLASTAGWTVGERCAGRGRAGAGCLSLRCEARRVGPDGSRERCEAPGLPPAARTVARHSTATPQRLDPRRGDPVRQAGRGGTGSRPRRSCARAVYRWGAGKRETHGPGGGSLTPYHGTGSRLPPCPGRSRWSRSRSDRWPGEQASASRR